jgi:hypothetical protein
MILNDIPDIRIFWSKDTGFLSQFEYEDKTHTKIVKYKVGYFMIKISRVRYKKNVSVIFSACKRVSSMSI